ncbi:MAG: sigma-54 interaction domain-containing protein [Bradymonadaceae bacterium]
MVQTRPDIEPVEFYGMVTVSDEMSEFFELVERVAKTDAAALIRGETGTGKELVAEAIHDLSRRSDGPFQVLNCATLTPELLASELFGHVEGAFTGAVEDREGLFKKADGGTVFLDEIAELPIDLQARLLRVLQEGSFSPVGQTESISVDVRLISATHTSLRNAVERGEFREDLMYRIRVVPLFLPRLADRDGDIEVLAWHFIDELAAESPRTIEAISEEAMEAMRNYAWPGNVRELRNVIQHAYVVGTGQVLELEDLTPEIRGEPPPNQAPETMTETDLERRRLLEALDEADGEKQKAADLLDISRTTLWRKLKEHGISES